MKKHSISSLAIIQMLIGLLWLHSSWEKWAGPAFIDNIGATLQSFADKTSFAWYGKFLESYAVPNAQVYGQMVRVGELAVALAFVVGAIWLLSKQALPKSASIVLVVASFCAALMNINFFFASGSLSPAGWSLNLLMTGIQIVLGVYYINLINTSQQSGQLVVE